MPNQDERYQPSVRVNAPVFSILKSQKVKENLMGLLWSIFHLGHIQVIALKNIETNLLLDMATLSDVAFDALNFKAINPFHPNLYANVGIKKLTNPHYRPYCAELIVNFIHVESEFLNLDRVNIGH